MPKEKLTNQFIKGITPPADGRVDYQDETLPGLVLRVTSKGHMSYSVSYWMKGRRPRVTLGDASVLTLADARVRGREILIDVKLGIDPAAAKRAAQREEEEAITFAELAHDYVERWAKVYKAPKSAREDELRIKSTLIPRWGSWKAADVRKRDVKAVINEYVDAGHPYMANRVHGLVSKIFNYGRNEADVVENNPASGIRRQPEKPRERVLEDDELKVLLPRFREEGLAGLGFRLLLLTGQRPGEVFGMRWSEVDGETWNLPAERSKNGRGHSIPLSPAARAVLNELRAFRSASGFVFPSPQQGKAYMYYQRPYRRVKKAAGLESDWRIYDFKTTVLTGIEKLGAAGPVVSAIANHTPQGVTKRHYALYDFADEKRAALDAWGQHVEKLDPATRAQVIRLQR